MSPENETRAMRSALKLSLMFHSAEQWTHDRIVEWSDHIRTIEHVTGRAIPNGCDEATTRVLGDAIRAALGRGDQTASSK